MACLDVEGRRCLVVGGGVVGLEKAAGLAVCGARVTVVSPSLDAGFAELDVEWREREYETDDLEGMFLVIAGLVAFIVTAQRRSPHAPATVVGDQHGELAGPAG
jgi:precorrin-2 dehydrogenase/sirohydrochlorin ferrochelatase